jgi:hypothetical protein
MERIWIYQANRLLTTEEETKVREKLEEFTAQWNAHGHPLAASVEIRYHLFIILAVDQSVTMPSGCSIDKSVRLLKKLEQELNISLFDRMQIAYRAGDDIKIVQRSTFEELIQKGEVTKDTIVFNNLVADRVAFNANWETSFQNSWHAQVFA